MGTTIIFFINAFIINGGLFWLAFNVDNIVPWVFVACALNLANFLFFAPRRPTPNSKGNGKGKGKK